MQHGGRLFRTLGVAVMALTVTAAAAAAQGNDSTGEPAVNDSDFDTNPPAEDEAYLNDDTDPSSSGSGDAAGSSGDAAATGRDEAAPDGGGGAGHDGAGADPAVAASDFDTEPPGADESFLNDDQDLAGTGAEDATPVTPNAEPARDRQQPAAGVVAVLAVAVGAAGLLRSRRA